jgi:hypothetical protein
MNLAGRAFTYISLRVQPSIYEEYIGLAELFTGFHRDSLGNESHITDVLAQPDDLTLMS